MERVRRNVTTTNRMGRALSGRASRLPARASSASQPDATTRRHRQRQESERVLYRTLVTVAESTGVVSNRAVKWTQSFVHASGTRSSVRPSAHPSRLDHAGGHGADGQRDVSSFYTSRAQSNIFVPFGCVLPVSYASALIFLSFFSYFYKL